MWIISTMVLYWSCVVVLYHGWFGQFCIAFGSVSLIRRIFTQTVPVSQFTRTYFVRLCTSIVHNPHTLDTFISTSQHIACSVHTMSNGHTPYTQQQAHFFVHARAVTVCTNAVPSTCTLYSSTVTVNESDWYTGIMCCHHRRSRARSYKSRRRCFYKAELSCACNGRMDYLTSCNVLAQPTVHLSILQVEVQMVIGTCIFSKRVILVVECCSIDSYFPRCIFLCACQHWVLTFGNAALTYHRSAHLNIAHQAHSNAHK